MSTFAEGLDLNNLTPVTPAWEFVIATHRFLDPMGETRIVPPQGPASAGITEQPLVPFPGVVEGYLPRPVQGEYIFEREEAVSAWQHPNLNAVRWAEHAHIRERYPKDIVRLSQLRFQRRDDYDVADPWGDIRFHQQTGIVRYDAFYDPSRNPYDAFVVTQTTYQQNRSGELPPYFHRKPVPKREITELNDYLEWGILSHFARKVHGRPPYDKPSGEQETSPAQP